MDGKKVKGWTQFNHSYNIPLLCGAVPDDWEKISCLEYFAEIDFDTDAEVIILLCMGYDILYCGELADEFKRRGKTVIFGSHLDQFSEKILFDKADSMFHGSPSKKEMRIMLEDALNGSLKKIYEFGMDLNFPFDYEAIKGIKMPYIQTMMGLGCRNNCDYCCTASVYKGKYRMRKSEFVISDLKAISKMSRYAAFIDSNIYNNDLYLQRICKEIICNNFGLRWGAQSTIDIGYNDETLDLLYRSGCRLLFIGFESLSNENLKDVSKNYNPESYELLIKKIRRHGIQIAGYFMFGMDDDNADTFENTLKFIKKTKITFPLLNVLLPVPGSVVYNRLKEENRLSFPDENEFYTEKPMYSVPCHKCYFEPKNFSPEELESKYLGLYRKVSRLPWMIKRSIVSNPADSLMYLMMNMGLRKEYRKMRTETV